MFNNCSIFQCNFNTKDFEKGLKNILNAMSLHSANGKTY
jgi:hypothetical protein